MIPLLLHLAWAQQVPAEQSFDAHGFVLSAFDGDLRDFLVLQRAGRLVQGDWFVGGLFEYANAPLVEVVQVDDEAPVATPALDHVVAVNLNGGAAVHERLRLDATLPVFLYSVGREGEGQGAAFGDLRLSAMVPLLLPGADDQGGNLGLFASLDLPSGAGRKFLGQRTVSGGFGLAGGGVYRRLTLDANVGVQLVPSIELDNLDNADQLTAGLGVGVLASDRVGLSLEGRGGVSLRRNDLRGSQSPLEGILSLRYRHPGGGFFVFGASAGAPQGVGAARFRLFVGGGFGRISEEAAVVDTDGDGLLDPDDACPLDAEVVNGYQDDDGCPDRLATVTVQLRYPTSLGFRPGATLDIGGAEQHRVLMQEPSTSREVMPDTSWTFDALHGCLRGVGAADHVQGDVRVELPMQVQRQTPVSFVVSDTSGQRVPGATVTWQSKTLACTPEEPLPLADDGTGEQRVGPGEHHAFVAVEGYRIHHETVIVDSVTPRLIEIVLEPTRIEVKVDEIHILEKVYFATDEAVILPQSFPLLQEVADTLLASPRIALVEVQGHTDSRGSDEHNLDLSQRRADAVRAFLIERGVAAERLQAKGYGETAPVADNATTAGQDKNRRVQFMILEDTALQR